MNLADVIVVILAILLAYRGWRRGLLGQVFELGGGFLGLVVGVTFGPRIADAFTDRAGVGAVLVSLLIVFLCLSMGQALGYVIGHRSGSFAKRARLGGLDAVLGCAFGIVITFLTYWLVGSLLAQSSIRPLARELQRSTLLRAMIDVSEPPDVLGSLRQYLATTDFPQVFAGLPPQIGPPVELPSGRVARRAKEAAEASTVRIVVPACGGTQLGSGWIAAESTVVTNAHVVAGGQNVTVQELASGGHAATVVGFDKDTDVAILHVEGLTAPALELETDMLERGTPGATLGYPGSRDGNMEVLPAAVQGAFQARGRDIYGRAEVTRSVYELRAGVEQGDSGGPFVLPDGRVAGVIFAASTTDARTGYALVGAEVADDISRGSGRVDAVGTGACTR